MVNELKQETELQQKIRKLEFTASVLRRYAPTLERWSYENMRFDADGMERSYKEMTYASVTVWGTEITVTFHGPETRAAMTAVRRAIGGHWDKRVTEYSFTLHRMFGGTTTIELTTPEREQVCTRRVIGKKTRVIPAREERVVTEDVVEWDCGPLLDS